MVRIWKQLQALLESPRHPGDAKKPVNPIDAELRAAKAAWQSEQSIVAATRYITLLEFASRDK